MNKLNLTQHPASFEQKDAGVVDPSPTLKATIVTLLNFTALPSPEEIEERASKLLDIVRQEGYQAAMIGGAPYLVTEICRQARRRGIIALHSFTQRESVEEVLPDGSTKKVAVFRHVGFVVD